MLLSHPPHRRASARLTAAVAVCAGVLTCASGASASTTAAASSGSAPTTVVSASLRYTDGSDQTVPVWSNIRVSIARNGAAVTDGQPLPADAQSSFFSPPKLLALDLDDDHDPEVLVDVFTAGFDCCRRTVLLHRDGTTYDATVNAWGDGGYRLKDVVGGDSPEFLSADGRFPALFDSDARGPLRVLSFSAGRLADVSLRALPPLARDAKIHQRAWDKIRKARKGDARPVIAALAVDLVRLGRIDRARRAIRNGARHHELRDSAAKFSARIDARMVAWGYAPKAALRK